ncbi:hypothetical protein EUX98_g6479 [Antrodiella citrinella]|uniref:Flavodoxin-like domain-containing protein n=1 Tax=Antrodiella citrinella TaxID=2447956 RepID=A0A4S4MRG0_9APHY|nr:hypothetical protein EUX98_g6479 [Antrodiella citrinella]
MTIPIPAPFSVPFLGNITAIDKEVPLYSYNLLASQYGEIYQLNLAGRKVVVINTNELVNEVSDEKRFMKNHTPGLSQVRNTAGDGLFTAKVPGEQNWYIAHRLLMPAFSTMNTRNMFDDMNDIVSQMVSKWDRFGPNHLIDPAADFTKITLDALSLCAMSYRLNSFYSDELHPFAKAMTDFLAESGRRSLRPAIMNSVLLSSSAKYQQDQNTMFELVNEIIEHRKANPSDRKDLLHVMLTGVDKETGLSMPEDNIKKNLLTFLIAGHETTSGMLTFALYYLLRTPEAMRKLREEIDEKIGSRPITADDMHKLPYLLAVMREVLRMSPSAPQRSVAPLEDTVLAGKYALEKDTGIILNIAMAHRDPKVYGPDPDTFRPERMLDGKFEALPPNGWQPFGYGMRGCIGRPFAWQEVQMVLISILQNFDLVPQDPAYELQIRQTLTIKPKNFYIRAIPRAGKPQLVSVPAPLTLKASTDTGKVSAAAAATEGQGAQPLYVLYGSNTGSSEAFAQRIATEAANHGFRPTLGTLDSAIEHVPKDGPVFIVTASFEGQPADNAAHFVEWITTISGSELSGVKFGVFGCGNRDWVATYQRIPRLIDEALVARGATKLVERGEGDAGGSEFFDSFDAWEANLWPTLSKEYTTQTVAQVSGLSVKTVQSGPNRAEVLRQADTALGTVVENKLLTSPNAPAKRHLEFALPEGTTFRAGDYLAILPKNPLRDVRRAIARFGLPDDQEVEISSVGPSSLPTDKPITLSALFSGYVELSQPATTRDLRLLSDIAKDSADIVKALSDLNAAYGEKVVEKRLSVLDILEDYPSIQISLEQFLQLLPTMRVRQYSISSSPLWKPSNVTLTVSILEAPARSGRETPFQGVSSTYLAGLQPGDKVSMAVRASNVAFHPPSDTASPAPTSLALADDARGVRLVDEVRGGVAVLLHHPVGGERVRDRTQLDAAQDGGRELAGAVPVALGLWRVLPLLVSVIPIVTVTSTISADPTARPFRALHLPRCLLLPFTPHALTITSPHVPSHPASPTYTSTSFGTFSQITGPGPYDTPVLACSPPRIRRRATYNAISTSTNTPATTTANGFSGRGCEDSGGCLAETIVAKPSEVPRNCLQSPDYFMLAETTWPYVRVINVGEKIMVNNIQGYLQSRVVFFLMNIHNTYRTIYFARSGHSLVSHAYKSDSWDYAESLPEFVLDRRTGQISQGSRNGERRPATRGSYWAIAIIYRARSALSVSCRFGHLLAGAHTTSHGRFFFKPKDAGPPVKVVEEPPDGRTQPPACGTAWTPDQVRRYSTRTSGSVSSRIPTPPARAPRAEELPRPMCVSVAGRLEPNLIELEERETEDLLIIGHASGHLIGDLIEVVPTSYGVHRQVYHFWDGPGRSHGGSGKDEHNFYENDAEDTQGKGRQEVKEDGHGVPNLTYSWSETNAVEVDKDEKIKRLQDQVATDAEESVAARGKEVAQLQAQVAWYKSELKQTKELNEKHEREQQTKELAEKQAKELADINAQNDKYKNGVAAMSALVDQCWPRLEAW